MNDIFDLKGKTAIVTGASSGLGRHFAKTLSAAGANLVICARRLQNLEDLRKEIDGEEPVEAQQKPLKIYPNPTRDFLNIDSGNSENKIKQLELYNVLGQLIFSISNSTPKQIHKVDFSALSSGSYMLSITLEKEELLHRKVVRY